MATRIPVQFGKISIKTRQISTPHQKQVAPSLISLGKGEDSQKKNVTHAKATKTGSAKNRSKFENLEGASKLI